MRKKVPAYIIHSSKTSKVDGKEHKLSPLIENTARVKILLIDDFDVEHIILRRHLLKAAFNDFKIDQVASYTDALKRVHVAEYDIVLLNDMSGNSKSIEFLVPLMRDYLQEAPIIIISNNSEPQYLSHAEALGANYIVNRTDLAALMLRLIPLFKTKELALSH